jgi:hypothetical protein
LTIWNLQIKEVHREKRLGEGYSYLKFLVLIQLASDVTLFVVYRAWLSPWRPCGVRCRSPRGPVERIVVRLECCIAEVCPVSKWQWSGLLSGVPRIGEVFSWMNFACVSADVVVSCARLTSVVSPLHERCNLGSILWRCTAAEVVWGSGRGLFVIY